eukprot:CAMPEP_0170494394 /NCGR_PEP_ID=MMETSP0208-20121228/14619_1 /TAXON_ID=197538 /ORGANISM="Strombidium inclinatum, Strain S3" /LENGTH=60 /DNA_ID=CAMNT_0010770449 /DNA_START=1176 /DNA_END=1358 /DNA_ORIENTATION=+
MLGETYELVMDDFKFFAEQVSHHPPKTAYRLDGTGYRLEGYTDATSTFGFGGGRGQIDVD